MNIYMTGNEWKEGKKPNMATEGKANSMWKKGKDSSCRKQKLLDSVWYKHSILKSLVMTGTMIHNISVWPGGKQWKPRQMVRSTTIMTKKESLRNWRNWGIGLCILGSWVSTWRGTPKTSPWWKRVWNLPCSLHAVARKLPQEGQTPAFAGRCTICARWHIGSFEAHHSFKHPRYALKAWGTQMLPPSVAPRKAEIKGLFGKTCHECICLFTWLFKKLNQRAKVGLHQVPQFWVRGKKEAAVKARNTERIFFPSVRRGGPQKVPSLGVPPAHPTTSLCCPGYPPKDSAQK